MSEPIAARAVGAGPLSISVVGFGAAPIGNYGRPVTDDEAHVALDSAWELGLRFYDTAPLYGVGLSERRTGAYLACKPREEFVLSTKAGRVIRPNPHPTGTQPNEQTFYVPDTTHVEWDFTAAGIRRSVEESLERLGLDRIDIALLHDPDDFVDQAMTESYPELERMRSEGTITAIGLGMNHWEVPLRFVNETDIDVVMVAGRYTLVDQSAQPLLDACAERGVGVLDAAPFNSGLLARAEVPETVTFDYRPAPTELIERARRISALCAAHGVDLPQAAVAFPLRHPAVVSVVGGMRNPAHVASAVAAVTTPISDALWAELESTGLVAPIV